MSVFHFSLDRVLRWRAIELATEQAKLEQLVREQVRLQGLRAQWSAAKSKLIGSLAAFPDLRGEDLRAAAAHNLFLKRQLEKLIELQLKCEQALMEQRKKFREAKQRVRLLEQLKERRFAEWRHSEDLQIETLSSELYLASQARRMGQVLVEASR